MPGVYLTERRFFGLINLRGDAKDSSFLKGAERCLCAPLPLRANTVSESEAVTALWLGPDEWLLVTRPNTERQFVSALHDALQHCLSSVTDVTDGQTILRISGDRAIEVLQKGSSLDLHPRVFKPACCAQTLIAKVIIVIHCVDQAPSFDLVVRRSFSEYFVSWIQDAAAEAGFRLI